MKAARVLTRAARLAGQVVEAATPGQRWTAALALALTAAVLAWGAPIRRVTVVHPPTAPTGVTSEPVSGLPSPQPPPPGSTPIGTTSVSPLGR